MRKVLLGMVVMLLSGSFYCFGMNANDGNLSRDVELFQISQKYWNLNDLMLNSNDSAGKAQLEQKYDALSADYSKAVKEVSNKLLQGWSSDREYVQHFSEVYKSLPTEARRAFYPALEALRNEVVLNSDSRSFGGKDKFNQYFPGYGYGDPGTMYRKGKEVLREARGTTWQEEEKTVSSNLNVNLNVTLDILNMLKGLFEHGHISNLVVNRQFTMDYNGAPMVVFNVSFTNTKQMTTKTRRKYEVDRIWFELFSAPQSHNAQDAQWQLVGKTYEIIQDPTGDEFVVVINPSTN
ncbi:MAG: hypothetical protein HQM08_07960 [Candidatus Riflebacteria bacterium]|nr:hypothetical protein [Candidatus Riflebacteria bacterium]